MGGGSSFVCPRALAFLALVAWPSVAAADQPSLHVNGGLEVLGSSDVVSAGLRIHAGYGRSFGSGSVQPTISLGGTLFVGSLNVDEPAADRAGGLVMTQLGPEVTFALRFVRERRWADNRIFATAAYIPIGLDDDVQPLHLENVAGGHGFRIGVGASWVGSVVSSIEDSQPKSEGAFLWIAPQQLELVFEHSAGSSRYGAVLAWGI